MQPAERPGALTHDDEDRQHQERHQESTEHGDAAQQMFSHATGDRDAQAVNEVGHRQVWVDRLERGRESLRLRLARRGVLLGTALTSTWLLEGAAQAGMP